MPKSPSILNTVQLDPEIHSPDRGGPNVADAAQEIDALFQELGSWPPTLRKVIFLRLDGCSIEEIAGRLGTDAHTIRRSLEMAGKLLIEAGVLDPELVPRPIPGQKFFLPGDSGGAVVNESM